MIIGAKKAGTTALFDLLALRIPHVLPPDYKEFLYFLPLQMSRKKWKKELLQKQQQDGNDTWVPVPAIREDIFSQDYYPGPRELQKNNQSISFEATPGYLAFSTLSRIPLQCTFPWAKILVILRDPVDRCFSHYNFLLDQSYRRNRTSDITEMTFEQYIQQDLDRLEEFGVLPPKGKQFPASFFGSAQERQAWYNYQLECEKGSCLDMVVARSLYTLQLEEWFDGLREMGRDPQQEILVVRNENLKDNPDGIVDDVLDWLPLFTRDRTEGTITKSADKNSNSTGHTKSNNHIHSMVTRYRSAELSEETKSRLTVLFQPYNDRLYKLLGWNDSIQQWS
eukprot:Nitzschia sp. Nitz4//scaffold18_size181773//94138//95148//NITZ4_001920-RA/size181773-processed-gene-0.21-mRNA-1//1//CDS//3329540026//7921//frame0